ncbi:hypothetical protein TNCV_2999291 [Trichonephila clavipes]|nr:hypothetical protein TNCV_2999291 [Trichonephila clavipes]
MILLTITDKLNPNKKKESRSGNLTMRFSLIVDKRLGLRRKISRSVTNESGVEMWFQNDTEQDIMSDVEIIAVVTANERKPKTMKTLTLMTQYEFLRYHFVRD